MDMISELSAHPIVHGVQISDVVMDEDNNAVIRSNHKVGGQAHVINTSEGLPHAISQLIDEGCYHLLQFDFPDANDAPVSGNWPFGNGIFHLFGKEPLDRCEWHYLWEF